MTIKYFNETSIHCKELEQSFPEMGLHSPGPLGGALLRSGLVPDNYKEFVSSCFQSSFESLNHDWVIAEIIENYPDMYLHSFNSFQEAITAYCKKEVVYDSMILGKKVYILVEIKTARVLLLKSQILLSDN